MPERSVLDVLCNVEHWLNWTRHFGPVSGNEPRLKQPTERYIFTTFGYGCNIGPNETARHSRDVVTWNMISYTNRRHITTPKIIFTKVERVAALLANNFICVLTIGRRIDESIIFLH